ncbi:probable serine/threonine-protein kinase dyrk2 [Galleria mellonella]|uniref:Probable serine/threonine-protein kinase dyrk2 n=1 Tax=Galleria mellonella TaxID=7137 RepID=A0A6J3C9J7_GALME|nr:probable serine/threonine-protein kinase dyrk2 [Galleria mellonella]
MLTMRLFRRITLVLVCVFVLALSVARCEDSSEVVPESEGVVGSDDQSDTRKDVKTGLLSGNRRNTTQGSTNITRDSLLLSVLAARRKQFGGRPPTLFSSLPSIAQAARKGNTTYAKIEIRDANNVTIKRLTFEALPLQKVTTDAPKVGEIRPHETRHLFVPRIFQDNKSRTGFVNNRRRDALSINKAVPTIEHVSESGIVYVPPDKLEGLDKEVDLDPDEEFQVDESNHGLYLLNYSDSENITTGLNLNKTDVGTEFNENVTAKVENTTVSQFSNNTTDRSTQSPKEEMIEKPETNIIINSTDIRQLKPSKISSDKDKINHTLFMSDEIYNHFRPLESELPVEEMVPFIQFGKKLDGQVINDNLTNSPSLSASTKSVNFIAAPLEKRKFNSRYSATEKYKNTSADEEEINEDMDVSVVKNIIEKNKIRNTVKGPAPARHVNAYRKYSSSTQATTKSPNIAELNVTEPIIVNVTPNTVNKNKEINHVNTNITNTTNTTKEGTNSTQITKENIPNRTNTTILPRNFTRNYFNLRRRPARVTAALTTENIIPSGVNATTEKASTSVYTAVVTSVSITSSMKGQNKTDSLNKESENSTMPIENIELSTNSSDIKPSSLNETENTTILSSTNRPSRHRIRIRTTTTESSVNSSPRSPQVIYRPSEPPFISEVSTGNGDLRNETTTSRISERLANLLRQNVYDTLANGSTIRPRNILRRRRPTTTSTTTLLPSSTSSTTYRAPPHIFIPTEKSTISAPQSSTPAIIATTKLETDMSTTFKPFVVTSKTSSQSRSKPVLIASSGPSAEINTTTVNITNNSEEDSTSQNEEVVIEAEKTYTASYVLAGLGFLPIAAIVAFVLRNVLNKKTKEIDTEYEGYFDDSDIKKESPITTVARPPLPAPSKPDQKWEFPRNKLRLQTLLGQGNFGQVWKAEADDLNGHDGLTRLVAVKSIKETASQKEKQELLHEIYIMQKIGTHPNVVTLLACCTEQEPYLLIMEYVMCGKLLTYLRERRSRPDRFSGSGALTSRDLTVFAYCVARGMDYIASKGIVHRDLAARNVLVDHNKLCKIADFGMSRCAGASSRAARSALPVRWMAPEALLYNVYSHPTDVWAFGILLWEIVTLGSTPYAAMSGREVLAAVTEGYRLERPPHCKPQLYRAMHSCWHADPSQRPTFADLKAQLAELLDNEPSEGNYVDLDSFYQESSVYSDPSAIINDDEGLSAEYDRERRVFRELNNKPPVKFDNRAFSLRDEELRNKFGIGTPRMGGFGIRDVPFNERNFSDGEFNERAFTDKNFADRNFSDKSFADRNFSDKNFAERNFSDKNFTERNFTDKNFNDTTFAERKDGKLSTSSFHRERERENPLVSRNSFNGFPRIGTRDGHFQMTPDGRNKRVSEFECDI